MSKTRFASILTFSHNTIANVDKAAMAVESVDGARIENIVFSDIQFKNAGTAFFVLLGKRSNGFGSIDGQATKHTWGSAISGTMQGGKTYAPRNIAFRNVRVTFLGDPKLRTAPANPPEYAGQYPDPNLWGRLPAAGLYFRHVDDVMIDGSKFTASPQDMRPMTVQVDAKVNKNP